MKVFQRLNNSRHAEVFKKSEGLRKFDGLKSMLGHPLPQIYSDRGCIKGKVGWVGKKKVVSGLSGRWAKALGAKRAGDRPNALAMGVGYGLLALCARV